MFAFAAASALPLVSAVTSAQVPAQINLEDVQPVSGAWTYRAIAGGSEADFVDSTAVVRLEFHCDRVARKLSITRTGVPAAAPVLTVWTSSLSRSLPSAYQATKVLTATLGATNPLLDAIAFSRGRFATAASGAPMVALPSAPEIARVIEDCRG